MGDPTETLGSVYPTGPGGEALISAFPDLIFINRSDGTYLSCHASDPTQLYIEPEQFIRRKVEDVLPQGIAAQFAQAFRAAGDQQAVQAFAYELEVGGRPQFFEARVAPCTPDAFISIVRNITEHRATEAALRGNAMTLQAILASTADGILAIGRDRKVLHFNRRFVELWGIPAPILESGEDGQLLAHVLSQLEHPAAFLSKVEALYHSDQEDMDLLAFKDGRTVERYSLPMVLDGAVRGRVWSFRDITARVRAEAERASVERQRHLIGRAESLGRMAGSVAHHFNNKLQSILGPLDLLARQDPTPATEVLLTSARMATQQAAEISRQLATAMGQSLDRTTPCDLNGLGRAFLDSIRPLVSTSVSLEDAFTSAPLLVEVNGDRLHQALGNLASNALDALGGRPGTLRLETGVVPSEGIPKAFRHPVGWEPRPDPHAFLSLTDTGAGLSPGALECACDPFFSTKGLGRGLGLPVTLGIMQAHHGGLTLESAEGIGTKVTLYLPLLPARELTARSPVPPAGAKHPRNSILLIDDDELVLLATGAMLEELGYTVLTAPDGPSALASFPAHRDEVLCVISDLTMPGPDGWQTFEALRRIDPAVPVLLSSGYDPSEVLAGAHPLQPDGFLWKPYDLQTLKGELHRVAAATPPRPPGA